MRNVHTNPRPQPQDKNDQAVVIWFSRFQFLIIAAVFTAFLSLVLYLARDIYGGLKEDIKETKERVNKLNESFQTAYKAAIEVQQLITTSRELQHDLADTREDVSKLKSTAGFLSIGLPGESLEKFNDLRRITATPRGSPKRH